VVRLPARQAIHMIGVFVYDLFGMKISLFKITFYVLIFLFLSSPAMSQGLDRNVDVEAGVGDSFLSVSGYISPFASLVMDSKGVFLRSAVADRQGNFSISQVRVKDDFSKFCLKAVDFKRVGESTTCIKAIPVNGFVEKHDIFLPPTIGLLSKKVNEGESATVFGYTMPNASTQVHVEGRSALTVSADKTGYYETQLKELKRGKYVLYATATLEGKNSLVPDSRVELEAITGAQRVINWLLELIKWLWRIIIMFWIAIPILILIIILLYKLWPEKFQFLFFWKRRKGSDKQTRNTKHEMRNKLK